MRNEQEPIEDIHSLIYYAAGLVSSGDSMAREAALLGVPSYYLGIRYSMPANAAASKVASLQNQKTMAFEELGELITALAQDNRGRVTTEELLTELADVTIMCEQMAFILGFEDYEKEMDRKLIRLRDEKLKL